MAREAALAAPSQPTGPHQSGSRLWQNGRLARSYDKLGPCLGSGGMGSVWAARVSSSGESSGCVGSWVAVKAIPMELGAEGAPDVNGLHSGLRECLSTFRDLSPVHVVRYDSYWLEEPSGLPSEVHQFCEHRLGRRLRAAFLASETPQQRTQGTPSGTGHPTPTPLLPHPSPSPSGGSFNNDSVSYCVSARFRERTHSGCNFFGSSLNNFGPGSSSPLDQQARWPCSPSECGLTPADSCGFVWELPAAATSSANASPRGESPPPLEGSLRTKSTEATNTAPRCAVLFIEMELMCAPPDGRGAAATDERLTLRTWLQRHTRTLSDAAEVFGSLMLSVRHIHRKRIIHADLKPDNLFCVAERNRITAVKIGDFGLAGENQQDRQFSYEALRASRIMGGTPGYVAPEILRAERERDFEVCPSEKVDIFACAVILLELLLKPFRTQMERVQILDRFRIQKAPFNVPELGASKNGGAFLSKTRALLAEMSAHDPAVRLSAEEVCKRFEKEVRKELCRSSTKDCCDPSDCVWRCQEPVVQPGREVPKDRPGSSAQKGGGSGSVGPGSGGQRRKGKKSGRRGG
mmetsp:Transcript_148265/g.369623  ORF Transcript_148265/g.369623 Transcript_148265/m.369623 type:complete len:576 (+) Transcript_148265:95-1822(+)